MDDETGDERAQLPGAGIFMHGSKEELPEPWRDRVVTVWLLPLTPKETLEMLQEPPLRSQLSAEDAAIASLLASGLTPYAIASRTGKSPRTIHRRLARLRELLQTTSTAELALIFARSGF